MKDKLLQIHLQHLVHMSVRGVNVGGVGGWFTPQRHWLVGLKMRAIGLKINITQLKDYTRCRAKIDNISN